MPQVAAANYEEVVSILQLTYYSPPWCNLSYPNNKNTLPSHADKSLSPYFANILGGLSGQTGKPMEKSRPQPIEPALMSL
jgi:hypothetical protein